MGVCPECNHHFRLPVATRLELLLDADSFEDLSGDLEPLDVLGFADSKPYAQRIEEAQRKTGKREGVVYGTGTVDGHPLVVAAMDFAFIGGSMGSGVGEAITRAAELALERHQPLLVDLHLGRGAHAGRAASRSCRWRRRAQAFARLHEEGVLTMCLLTDPTYGGVSASFATLGDVLIAEPRAYVGFAGPKVIEQTIRQQLPEGFQTAEFLLEHGMLDVRRAAGEPARRRREAARAPRPVGRRRCPSPTATPPVSDADALERRPAWDVVQLARNQERPNTLEYVGFVFDDFQELYGDRLFQEDASIVGGVARLGDLAVVVIGHQKGHTTSEMMERNFGMPNPEGYRKGVRLMRHAARFGMPVVTFVDTPGAYPGIGAEERGQSIAIAESIMEMSRLPVPIVVLVTGEGGSGGALALARRRPRADDGELRTTR